MIKIKRIGTENEIHYYVFDIFTNIHNELINFLHKLDFSNDELNKIDVLFSELDGEYIFVRKENMKIHFFICNKKITMVIDTKEPYEPILESMKKYFTFFKKDLYT